MLNEAIISFQDEEVEQKPLYFHSFCERWLADKKVSLELTSYEGYRYKVGIISAYFEKHPVLLSDLVAGDVSDFYRYLLTVEREINKQLKVGYANRTMKDVGVLMRSILKDALMLHLINENPAVNVKVPHSVEDIEQKSYIGAENVDTFLNVIKGHRLELPLTLCLYYGLRREEVLGLKWSAIRDNKMYIEHTVARFERLSERTE